MASANSIPHLFTELNLQLNRENYPKSIDICNKIRSKVSNDPDAIKIKCVCLMREGKFDKALDICGKNKDMDFEKAYCLYKLQNFQAALELIHSASEPKGLGLIHLEAQVKYRLNDFESCISIYEDLLKNEKGDPMEISTNLLAAYAAAGKKGGEILKKIQVNETSYETAYNTACLLIAEGQFDLAKEHLILAEKLCRETLEAEGCSPEDIQSEIALILVQTGYVYQMCGEKDKALNFYRDILQSKKDNAAVNVVASNNLVVLRGDRDLFDSFKRLKNIFADDMTKLSSSQSEMIAFNRALVLCLMNKGEECREAVQELQTMHPKSEKPLLLLSALHLREKRVEACRQTLLEKQQQQKDDCNSLIAPLILAHTYVLEGNYGQAATILSSIQSIQHRPGTVSTLVELYKRSNDIPNALQVFKKANAYHLSCNPSSPEAITIMEADASFKLSIQQYEEAASSYETLLNDRMQLNPDTRLRALSSLVIALSYFDPKTAERKTVALPPLDDQVQQFDLESLEKQQVPRHPRSKIAGIINKVTDAESKRKERKRAARDPVKVAKKRQKRREAYLEELRSRDGYNASIGLPKPDPERWIPRKQRSYAKRGRKGRNKFVGAQGSGSGALKDAQKLDVAARVAAKKLDAEREEKKGTVATEKTSAILRKSKKKKRR